MSARVPDGLASRFEAFASSRGGKSRVLRAMMEAALQGDTAAAEMAGSPGGRSSKVTLRLKEAELRALDEACVDAGLRRTEWIVALVRRRLSGCPQFDRASAASLLEARRELRRLGVNLREMAGASAEAERGAALELEALRGELRKHLECIRQAIVGNLAYWDVAQE